MPGAAASSFKAAGFEFAAQFILHNSGCTVKPPTKRDSSLRKPIASQERSEKKKSACSVRNDGCSRGRNEKGLGI